MYAQGLRLAGFVHQLKSPLQAIQIQAELMLEAAPTDEARRSLDIILRSARLGAERAAGLLEKARPGGAALESLPLAPVLEEICSAVEPLCRRRGISLERKLDQTPSVPMDRISLEGALHNFVNNAVEAMPSGGLLKVSCRENASRLAVAVIEDTGPGMSREELSRALRPLQSAKPGGAGLGLFIARHILRKHHASLRWDTAPGHGTRVTIMFQPRGAGR
jgi:signal transduction histidine kinase